MPNFNFKSFGDLSVTIRKNISKIPFDFDLIVGIPRSGIIPAYMIALFLNKKVCSLDEFLLKTTISSGYSRQVSESKEIKKVLIVDDSIHSGVALGKTKDKIKEVYDPNEIEIKYLAIYAREQAIEMVDYYFEIVPLPRMFQWNYLNININERSCFDIDGVLCVDPTREENDDGEKYRNFILTAKPLYIPKYKIKALVTSRLEKYRAETEEWLRNNNVQYEKLYMLDLPNKEARVAMGAHGIYKAKMYSQSSAELFVESEPDQAELIAKLSGKPCICVENDTYYEGDGECKIDIFDLKEFERVGKKKRLLLYSHEFTYTGAPHSLLRICKVLKDEYYIEVWGPDYGEFVPEFESLGIKVRIVPNMVLKTKNVIKAIKSFDCCLANTIITNKFYSVASKYVPTVWYIREATNIPEICRANPDRDAAMRYSRDLYCVSEYAADFIIKNYNKKVNVLRNCSEDYAQDVTPKKDHSVVNFLQLGTISERKGFTEYVEAYKMLPEELQQKSHLYFAGRLMDSRKNYWEPLLNSIEDNPNITYLGEIKGMENKQALFSNIDVFVVASYDESCSLVVLEGAMLSKPLIVTENVGAKYMVSPDNGLVVETKNVEALSEAYRYFIENSDKIDSMGAASREAYDKLATMELYSKNINALIKKYLSKNKVVYKIANKISWINHCSLMARFFKNIKENGLRYTIKKSKRYLNDKFRKSKQSKSYVKVMLFGTSASKTAIDNCNGIRVVKFIGKQSVTTCNREPFTGDLYITPNNKSLNNVAIDIKKSLCSEIVASDGSFLVIDLLDEKFDLIRFNGKYVISKSDTFMNNLDKVMVEGIPFSKKRYQRYNLSEDEMREAVWYFCEKVKQKYPPERIILHEAYFALKYIGKDGKIHSFPENRVETFTKHNDKLAMIYSVLKEMIPSCNVIKYDKEIFADESHKLGLSTMHFTDNYYNNISKQMEKIFKTIKK